MRDWNEMDSDEVRNFRDDAGTHWWCMWEREHLVCMPGVRCPRSEPNDRLVSAVVGVELERDFCMPDEDCGGTPQLWFRRVQEAV
jgi:hypothetical protein